MEHLAESEMSERSRMLKRMFLKMQKQIGIPEMNREILSRLSVNVAGLDDYDSKTFKRMTIGDLFAIHYKQDPYYMTFIFHADSRILTIESNFDDDEVIRKFYSLGERSTDDSGFTYMPVFEECDDRVEKLIRNAIYKRNVPTLPLVIVTLDHWVLPIDPGSMAEKLFGLAHVIVTPEPYILKLSSVGLKDTGILSVILPADSNIYRYDVSDFNDENELIDAIVRLISMQRSTMPTSWSEMLEIKIENVPAVEEKTDDHEELIEKTISEVDELKQKCAEYDKMIKKQNAKLDYYMQMRDTENGLLSRGNEKDYYEDEVREIIIRTLKEAIPYKKNRVKDILTDIVEHNPIEGYGDELREEIRAIFKADPGLGERSRMKLGKLGCEITSDGKHHKLLWHGDPRYHITVSKSPSLQRAGVDEAVTMLQQIM